LQVQVVARLAKGRQNTPVILCAVKISRMFLSPTAVSPFNMKIE
jgi:hypothetical protein